MRAIAVFALILFANGSSASSENPGLTAESQERVDEVTTCAFEKAKAFDDGLSKVVPIAMAGLQACEQKFFAAYQSITGKNPEAAGRLSEEDLTKSILRTVGTLIVFEREFGAK